MTAVAPFIISGTTSTFYNPKERQNNVLVDFQRQFNSQEHDILLGVDKDIKRRMLTPRHAYVWRLITGFSLDREYYVVQPQLSRAKFAEYRHAILE